MCRLHGTGTSASQHDETLAGEAMAQVGDVVVERVGAQHGVSAHDAHVATRVVLLQEASQCRVDAVVVQCACQQFVHVAGVLSRCLVLLVDNAVKALAEGFLAVGVKALVQLGCRVQRPARHVKRHLVQVTHGFP